MENINFADTVVLAGIGTILMTFFNGFLKEIITKNLEFVVKCLRSEEHTSELQSRSSAD